MTERFFLFIKHKLKFLWRIIEQVNSLIFAVLYHSRMNSIAEIVLQQNSGPQYSFRRIKSSDLATLHNLLNNQNNDDLKYFKPHSFDLKTLHRMEKDPAFLMMGAFEGDRIAGYFFLRCFCNKKCFVGRMIDKDHRGKGIGRKMNNIMYSTAWETGFRCMSTISKKNEAVMRSHSNNPYMVILRELNDDYLLVEFEKNRSKLLNKGQDQGR